MTMPDTVEPKKFVVPPLPSDNAAEFNGEWINVEQISRADRAKLPVHVRQTLIENIFIGHERYRKAYEAVARFHFPFIGGKPDKGKICILFGNSRSGKSHVLCRYSKHFPPTIEGTGKVYPIIQTTMPENGSISGMLRAIMSALGIQVSNQKNQDALIRAVVEKLPEVKAQILFMDEYQRIALNRSQQVQKQSREIIKTIVDQCGVNIVLTGLPSTYDLVAKDTQIVGRGGLPYHRFDGYDWQRKDERNLFRALCGTIDQRLPFSEVSNLSDPYTAHRLYTVSNGMIGRLVSFLFRAAAFAVNDDASCITDEHFSKVFSSTFASNGGLNLADPFQVRDHAALTELTRSIGSFTKSIDDKEG